MGIVPSPIAISKLFGKNEIFFIIVKPYFKNNMRITIFLIEIPFNVLSTAKNIHGMRI